jgi:outer membrane protein assembly factor BamB
MKIDPSMRGKLPKVEAPIHFMSKEGNLKGWRVAVPGGRPLATPAVVDGRVFLGGGFGSYEFYAFDAATGRVAWEYQTTDDGPTAAVAQDGYVAFNTESCELEVLTTRGRRVWKKWLGDPLMSMPAMDADRVYVAFPDSRGDHQHYLAAFELGSGREAWRSPIESEIVTAPVLQDGGVYLTNLQGTMFCLRKQDGRCLWRQPKNATSSPMVWNGQCYFSQRREVSMGAAGKQRTEQWEHLAARGVSPDASTKTYTETAGLANYLDFAKRQKGSPRYAGAFLADASVGFGGFKGDAKVHLAMKNLGHGHVYGVWAYQGSKPFVSRGHVYSALGDTVHCVDPCSGEVRWKKRLGKENAREELLDSVLTPPAIVNGKLFVGSIFGDLFCLSANSGNVLWSFQLNEAVIFQPAVAQGRVYVTTEVGGLYCIETGDPGDHGWHMWGATAAHNGLAEPEA